MPAENHQAAAVSLDSVLTELEHWRANKSEYPTNGGMCQRNETKTRIF